MHFIITGGAGFIGSHLVESLLSDSHQITVIDNLSTGRFYNLLKYPNLNLLEEDVLACNSEQLLGQYDGLVHLAATPSVNQSWLDPLAIHKNNTSGTIATIQLCHALKIPRLVFASSAAVYGNPSQVPISEATPTHPISPYGLQKLASEQYIALFAKHLELSAVNLRLFNVFGPLQDPYSPYSGVISIFAKAMTQGSSLSINGDGTQTRDFIYVKDVARAFAQALTVPLDPGTHLTCNIGTGNAISLLQLKNTLQKVFPEWQGETSFRPPRPGDIQDSLADIRKARSYLGFDPKTSLETGLMELRRSLKL